MIKDIYIKKKLASNWFSLLQQIIFYEFENIEKEFGKKFGKKSGYFKKKIWNKSKIKDEGGGLYAVIKDGLIFDSVGVNFSDGFGKI